MFPFKAIRKEILIDYITGEHSEVLIELELSEIANPEFKCIGRDSTCKGWNKEYGDYIMDCYTYLKPKYNKHKEEAFLSEIYYFHNKKESDEFHTTLLHK